MEQVFFRLHVRSVTTVTRLLPRQVRTWLEYTSLFSAICLLVALVWLHTQFVNPRGTSGGLTGEIRELDPRAASSCLPIALANASVDASTIHILQIHLQAPQPVVRGQTVLEYYHAHRHQPVKYYSIDQGTGRDAVGTLSGPGTLDIEVQGTADNTPGGLARNSHAAPSVKKAERALTDVELAGGTPLQTHSSGTSDVDIVGHEGADSIMGRVSWGLWGGRPKPVQHPDGQDLYIPDRVYLYSLEKGFLMLRQDLRSRHDIRTANVTINIHDQCLGGPIMHAMLHSFVGFDTVVMNWLISLYGGKGFLYGVQTKELFNLNYAAEFLESTEDLDKFVVFKVGVLFTTLFLFFTTTTLVSFTLRETQERMLKFTFLLQHYVRNRLPYAPLIFTHVVESLVFVPIMVGILFFLFEFFSDQLLAFMVLSVVWMCEVYSVISVRTTMCIRFFPRVFFLYFTLFHIYFFSFPFGFSYLALITTVLFLQHSMLFFWNRYEVPALRQGLVNILNPRMSGIISIRAPLNMLHAMPEVAGQLMQQGPEAEALQAQLQQGLALDVNGHPTVVPLAGPLQLHVQGFTAPGPPTAQPAAAGQQAAGGGGVELRGGMDALDRVGPLVGPGGAAVPRQTGQPSGASRPVLGGAGPPLPQMARTVSAPLLGSFPFSFWNWVQIPSAMATPMPEATLAQGWGTVIDNRTDAPHAEAYPPGAGPSTQRTAGGRHALAEDAIHGAPGGQQRTPEPQSWSPTAPPGHPHRQSAEDVGGSRSGDLDGHLGHESNCEDGPGVSITRNFDDAALSDTTEFACLRHRTGHGNNR